MSISISISITNSIQSQFPFIKIHQKLYMNECTYGSDHSKAVKQPKSRQTTKKPNQPEKIRYKSQYLMENPNTKFMFMILIVSPCLHWRKKENRTWVTYRMTANWSARALHYISENRKWKDFKWRAMEHLFCWFIAMILFCFDGVFLLFIAIVTTVRSGVCASVYFVWMNFRSTF